MSTGTRVAAVVAVGLGAAALVARASGAGAHDTAVEIALAGLGAVGAAVGGAAVSHAMRRRRLRAQVLMIGLGATATTAAGVLVAAHQMFIAPHDIAVLACVLLVSAAVAVGAGIRLSASFESEVERVLGIARELVTPAPAESAASSPVVTEELRRLTDELRAVSDELDASRARAQALEASRRELVAWVSHDLRSPIASMRAMAEALEDAVVDDPENVARYHRVIRQETERLSALVDDLFELSRISAGTLSPDDSVAALGELMADVLESVGPSALTRGIDIVPQVDDATDTLVPASHLRRALNNVLENAVRHTPAGGTLAVRAELSSGVLSIEVDDECGGIPDADLDRVFEVAFRGDAARTRDAAGGGLGLAIARGLLELHAGTIGVANRARGCRFTLRLPIAP